MNRDSDMSDKLCIRSMAVVEDQRSFRRFVQEEVYLNSNFFLLLLSFSCSVAYDS